MNWGPLTANRRNEISYVRSLVGGFGAFVVGYVLFYALTSGGVANRFEEIEVFREIGIEAPATWKGVTWVFYGAHNVESGLTGFEETSQVVELQQAAFWEPWFLVIPIVLLAVAGFLVARASKAADLISGAFLGAGIVLGYVLLVIVGNILSTYSAEMEGLVISGGPDVFSGIFFAGLLYPVVFGGIGGAIAAYTFRPE